MNLRKMDTFDILSSMRNFPACGKSKLARGLVLGLALSFALPVSAHEFWLQPHRFDLATGEKLLADIRIGQYFKGDVQPLIPVRAARFTLETESESRPVEGNVGDIPAVAMAVGGSGPAILAYQSGGDRIVFNEWQRFADYLALEGLDEIPAMHEARGLSKDKIIEIYTRYAKALVAAGGESGPGRAVGFPLELVALDDPFALADGADIRVRLLLDGAPFAGRQVSVFPRMAGQTDSPRIDLRSDADGIVRFRLEGDGPWLFSSVHMVPAPEGRAAEWESLWASLVIGRK